jgi:hypothetical protein
MPGVHVDDAFVRTLGASLEPDWIEYRTHQSAAEGSKVEKAEKGMSMSVLLTVRMKQQLRLIHTCGREAHMACYSLVAPPGKRSSPNKRKLRINPIICCKGSNLHLRVRSDKKAGPSIGNAFHCRL